MHLWRIRSALSSATPALTMLGTLGLAAWLSRSSSPSDGILAFAQADTEMVATVEVGRVASIEVDVGDVVAPGQVIVALDSGAIDAELAVARAEEARLRAMIPAEHARIDQELEAGVEELKLELAREVEEQRRARAEGEVLASEISRVKQLIEDKQASHDALGSLDVQRAGVEAIATEKPRTIQLLRAQVAAAEERRKKLLQQAGPETAKIEADLAVTRREIEQLEAQRVQHTLRAAHGGRVSAVRKRPGDVAVAGDPIVEISSAPGRVIACVPERAALHVEAGDVATIWARGQDGAPLTGRAVTVGPVVGQLPLRCWTDLNVPVWGREVTIALDHPVELLAGQAFDVAFTRGAAPPPAPPAPGAPVAAAAQGAPAAAAPLRARSLLRPARPGASRHGPPGWARRRPPFARRRRRPGPPTRSAWRCRRRCGSGRASSRPASCPGPRRGGTSSSATTRATRTRRTRACPGCSRCRRPAPSSRSRCRCSASRSSRTSSRSPPATGATCTCSRRRATARRASARRRARRCSG
ncbi:HlyD family secretion protein [Sorangium cellulosum]|uniref:Uncharacterized protein n=1 Tax=Sorangium cellulosum So0157-2 TaxID=1254432 RepID=S4Y522_SORCE|nr:biotin/lipoyl-binding protein [Sorangium cellulosum]AGP37993.1 hypothetical protein SCE1572_28095 [Sorangium cellulosum So0157-2]